MRVLILAAYYLPHTGGYITDTHTLARGLIGKGHSVEVVTCNTESSKAYETIDGVEVTRLPCWDLLDRQYPVPKPSIALMKLWRRNPDVISTQTRFFPTSMVGALLARTRRIPLIHTERGAYHSVVNSRLVDAMSAAYDHTLGSLVLRLSNKCVGVSEMSCLFIKHLGGREPVRIPLGVGGPFINKTRKGNSNKIIFVGRLVYGKGVQDLLSVFPVIRALVPDACLEIVGDGSYRQELERMAEAPVHFAGMKTQEEVSELLSGAGIFVNPSYSEGLPSSVAEAMAIGLPVVAYSAGGTGELVENGETGYLVSVGDKSALAQRIVLLLVNKVLAAEMGRAGQEKIRKEYQWAKVIDDYELAIKGMV